MATTQGQGAQSKRGLTLKEIRQRFVWKQISLWNSEDATRVKSLPLEVRSLGLTTAVAILLREGGRQKPQEMLTDWLLKEDPQKILVRSDQNISGRKLLERLLEVDGVTYRAAQVEAMALLGEAKILASALFKEVR